MASEQVNSLQSGIVFYDGDCGFCIFWVRFIIGHDKNKFFKFVSLQSELGEKARIDAKTVNLDTMIYKEGNQIFIQSSAWIAIAKHLDGLWKFLAVLKIIPKPIRDGVYKKVAKNRHRLQGLKNYCTPIGPEDKARFL